ncbi:MAG TPA: transposase [Bacteroidia bacterium]|jgi:REP element-mobilizing transposase RayT|nr:transposase [Bacteroidia bacterium]
MSHSYFRVWIHAIWSTKDREAIITPEAEKLIYAQLHEEFRFSGSPASIINGTADHVHALFLLSQKRSIAEVIRQVKGGSSHYINSEAVVPERFAWQKGYAAYSVTEKDFDGIYRYISRQKEHHAENPEEPLLFCRA